MSDYPKKTTLSPVASRSFSIIGEERELEQGGKSLTMQTETKRKWSLVSEHGERIAAAVGATDVGITDVKETKQSLRLVSPIDLELEIGENADSCASMSEDVLEDWEMETKILESKITSPHLTFYSQNRDVYTRDACTRFAPVASPRNESTVADVHSDLMSDEGITSLLTKNRTFDSKAAAKRLEMVYTSQIDEGVKEPKKPTAAFRSSSDGLDLPHTVDVPQELFQSSTLLSEEMVQESIRLVSEEHLAPPPPHFTPIWGKQRTPRTGWAKTQPVEFAAKKTGGQSGPVVSTLAGNKGVVVERRKNSGEKGLDELLGSWSQLSDQQKDEIRTIVQR